MDNTITLLLVEDNKTDAQLIKEMLNNLTDLKTKIILAETLSKALKVVNTEIIQIIILDLNLPDENGITTFLKMKKFAKNIPIIISSALIDKEVIFQAMKAGAQNYLIKGEIDSDVLSRAIHYAIWSHVNAE